MERLLLHICCGICASIPIEVLKKDGFRVSGFFYNPNIHPQDEYDRRLKVAEEVARRREIELIVGDYEPEKWEDKIQGLEDEPEGGRRCFVCYRLRLEETFKRAKEEDFAYFGTTLSISPHKNTAAINEAGTAIGQSQFLNYDFKKNEGFKLATAFARKHSFYRQHYCGCIFSKNAHRPQGLPFEARRA